MTKKYCDVCEKELTRDNVTDVLSNYDGYKFNSASIRVDVHIESKGDFCRACIVNAVREYDGY